MAEHDKDARHCPVDFRTDGLLWLINAAVLHSRGFALAVDGQTNELFLLGDGSEPWVFADGEGDEKFTAVESMFQRARTSNCEPNKPVHSKHSIDGYPLCWSQDDDGEHTSTEDELAVTCEDCLREMKE